MNIKRIFLGAAIYAFAAGLVSLIMWITSITITPGRVVMSTIGGIAAFFGAIIWVGERQMRHKQLVLNLLRKTGELSGYEIGKRTKLGHGVYVVLKALENGGDITRCEDDTTTPEDLRSRDGRPRSLYRVSDPAPETTTTTGAN